MGVCELPPPYRYLVVTNAALLGFFSPPRNEKNAGTSKNNSLWKFTSVRAYIQKYLIMGERGARVNGTM